MQDSDKGYYSVNAQFEQNRFLFHANAVAAAGQVHRIGDERVSLISPVHGESSLPTIGGVSRSTAEGSLLRFAEYFQYGRCETFAEGKLTENGQQAEAILCASVLDVRVLNRPSKRERPGVISVEFQAERLALDIRSVYKQNTEPTFELREVTTECMCVVITTEEDTRRIPIELVIDAAPFEVNQRTALNGGVALQSIVSHVRRDGDTMPGHVLVEKGLGKIYFGEVLVGEDSRRLTMVRVEMGSLTGASIALVVVEPNGIWK